MSPRIVIFPEYRPGHGLGHASRALALASRLEGRAEVRIPAEAGTERLEAIRALAGSRGVAHVLNTTGDIGSPSPAGSGGATDGAPMLFVLDRRRIDRREVSSLRAHGFVIGIDAAGSGRPLCDYLIDILPRVDRREANVRDMRLLDLPPRPVGGGADRVLVTFGGDDPARLGNRVVAALIDEGLVRAEDLDVLLPGLSGRSGHTEVPGVRYLRGPVNLAGMLGAYHTVVTSFGLTALEAAWAGCGVVLVNAGRYHAGLARRAGFRSATTCSVGGRRLRRGLSLRFADRGGAEVVRSALDGAEDISLSSLVSGLAVPAVHACPACGEGESPAIARFERGTYLRCRSCGMIYVRSFAPARSYGEEYFFEEYRRQYGRTYLEDAAHIREMGRSRLERIDAVSGRRPGLSGRARAPRLLDLGCAYGPFMQVAAEAGYEPAGIDVSEAAVTYVQQELGFRAGRGDLEEIARRGVLPAGVDTLAPGGADGSATPAARADDHGADGHTGRRVPLADVVTMWYVIEHIAELSAVLTWVGTLLPVGGVFAFSTPNARGISGRRSLRRFLGQSPEDHLTVWSPRSARRVLRRHGFRVRSIRVTGHHPERFPVPGAGAGGATAAVVKRLSRLIGLGDTFEVYATKER